MPLETPTAFFSYSREDSAFALRLAEDLKAAGANVWLDQLDIAPGQRWARAVEEALNNSPRVLVILSPASVSSTHVEDEVNFALEEHKTVIPVFYQDCKVPFQLRPFQYVDFRADYDRGLKAMVKTLGATSRSQPTPEPKPEPPPIHEEAPLYEDLERATYLQQESEKAALLEREEQERRRAEQVRLEREERERKVAEVERRFLVKVRLEQEERERQAAAEKTRLEEKRIRQQQTRREEQKALAEPAARFEGALAFLREHLVAACVVVIVSILLLVASAMYLGKRQADQVQQATGAADSAGSAQLPPGAGTVHGNTAPSIRNPSSAGSSQVASTGGTTGSPAASAQNSLKAHSPHEMTAKEMNARGDDYRLGNGVAQDWGEAVTWYRKAAEAGNPQAMGNLGFLYFMGLGTDGDARQGVFWCQKGAEAGDPTSMQIMGDMYKRGIGGVLEKNEQQAANWYRKAAERGDFIAMNALGQMYEAGNGVEQDKQQAIKWYRKAAVHGLSDAEDNLKRLGASPQ